MTKLDERLEAAHWGIEPIPEKLRNLSGFDLAVLWGNLGIGLLVIVTGGLLPALFDMSLAASLATIVLGSLIGCVLLGLGGLAGSREAVPTMALFRPVLGNNGSWVPSVLNAGQLLGWAAFEFWAMALVASLLTKRLFGWEGFYLWLLVFSALALGFSIWGPLAVVRAWMERFASWVLLAIALLLTMFLFTTGAVSRAFASGGAGGSLILGVPLDLVIAMPVSWLPLVADYNRFSTRSSHSFWGTFSGYLIANIWFYAIGVVLVMGSAVSPDPAGIATGLLALSGITLTGTLLLAGLLVGESDQAFANVYSASVSLRNIFPKVDHRWLSAGIALAAAGAAAWLSMDKFEAFLFLLGSVFVPLFGVWFADYFVLKNSQSPSGVRWVAMLPWLAGFIVYHWIVPTELGWWKELIQAVVGDPLSVRYPWLGASLPAFGVAFLLHLAFARTPLGRRPVGKPLV